MESLHGGWLRQMNKEDDDRRWILVEKMAHDIAGMREGINQIPSLVEEVAALRTDVTEMKGELVVHRQILKEHSAGIKELKSDVKELKSDVKEIKQIVGGQQEAITELKLASDTR
jgi:chromosome segregation ATPase